MRSHSPLLPFQIRAGLGPVLPPTPDWRRSQIPMRDEWYKPQQTQAVIMPLGLPRKKSIASGHPQATLHWGKGTAQIFQGLEDPGSRLSWGLCPRPASAETSCCLSVLQPPWGLLPQGYRAGQQQAIPASPFIKSPAYKTCYSVLRAKLVSIFMATENLKGGLFHLRWASHRTVWSKVVVLSTTTKALPPQTC